MIEKFRNRRGARRATALAVVVASCLSAAVVLGGQARAAVPPAGDKAEIQQAQEYLNGVTSLKARFMQVSPDGSTQEGTVYLLRPGRLRLEYDPPSPVLVIANDSGRLIYYDKQLKQVSYLPIDQTPAGVLVQPRVQLDGDDLEVLKVSHQPGVLDITVTRRSDPSQGRITLVFTDAPFALKQWQVVDQQGQVTTVSLFDTRTGLSLDHSLFQFIDPQVWGNH